MSVSNRYINNCINTKYHCCVHTCPTLKCDLYIHRIVYIVYRYHTIVYKQIHIQLYKYHVSLLRPHLSLLSIVTRLLPVTGCYIHSFLSGKMTMMIMMMILHSLIPIQEDDDDGDYQSKSALELKVKSRQALDPTSISTGPL